MIDLIRKLVYAVLRLFNLIGNRTKPPELDGGAPDTVVTVDPPKDAEILPTPTVVPKQVEENLKAPVAARWEIVSNVLETPFDTPIERIPVRRFPLKDSNGDILLHGVYSTYGRAPKELSNKEYSKARLKVHTNLPGNWNKGKPRLYMEYRVGEHLREGLKRAQLLEDQLSEYDEIKYEVLSYIHSLGAYAHRPIQHDPKNGLSYHSWAIAFDLNPAWNRGVTHHKSWQKRSKIKGKKVWVECGIHKAQRGPIHTVLPFSEQYYELYPKALPVELVMAFKSVHFAWGGDWGRSKWHKVVEEFGVRYDQNDEMIYNSDSYKEALREWKSIRYLDPMHFECLLRGSWAENHYKRMQAKIANSRKFIA